MQVYPNRFNETLSKSLCPCYLIFGDEPQQKFEIIEAVRGKAKQQGFEERTVFVADGEFKWNQLIEATQTLSLFSSLQYIELELPTGKPGAEGGKILTELAGNLGQDILLLIHGPKIGKDVQRAKWFKSLDDIGVHTLCYPLEGKQLHSWIGAQLRDKQLSVDANGVRYIADFCEGNMMAAHQEIAKLALLYPNDTISIEMLEHAMVDQSRFNVFQLVDVVLSGDSQRAVKILYRLESEGIEPNIIIWALIREWKLLWQLTALMQTGQSISWQKYGIWRNRQSVYEQALRRLNESSLKRIQEELEAADLAFKQQVVIKPYVKLCHLCFLFLGIAIPNLHAFE